MALHVLGQLPAMGHSLRAAGDRSGDIGRWIALAGAVVGGAVLAVALLPHFGVWTAPGALPHHPHHD